MSRSTATETLAKWAFLLTVIFLCGCNSNRYTELSPISQQELLSGYALFGEDASQWVLPEEDILSVDDAMKTFLQQHVERNGNRVHRLRTLMSAMRDGGLMNLDYSSDKTLTAQQAFHQQSGNCLAFTNLFVALAREIGLNATYQQVDIPPVWHRGGDFVVLNQHMNVRVKNPYDPDYMVDFNLPDYRGNYDTEQVDDSSAFAQYYSNVGVEYLENADYKAAFRYFKKALLTDQKQASIWVNLGALYSRNGHYPHAEAAYLIAIQLNRQHHVANSNLANFYQATDSLAKAQFFSRRSRYYRNANPYYHFWLAQQAYNEQRYELSIKHLNRAIARKRSEHLFFFLKGLSYHQLGNKKRAAENFSAALERSELKPVRENYQQKLDALMRRNDSVSANRP